MRIHQLAPHVADLIAAGEVVERPASVVKELVENALDAGASAVAVELRQGGMAEIRVTDDGCGMDPEDLPTAFLRHATSKLRAPEDLAGIATLGFRGEALAAIAAVSRVDVLTRQRGASVGASLHLEGGVPGGVEEAGAPEGTTVVVRDLFYNTPARLKFMRKDSAETAAVAGLMQHLALSRPDVSFRFLRDGADALHTPGDGRLESAVYAALGRDFARTLIQVAGRGGDTAVSGFVTVPAQGRGSRSMQVFFVNGRFIKSPLLTAAVEEGYRDQLLKGRFPGCVLSVTLPVTAVDVNVHPAKTQVKFAREKEVFDAVYHTVLDSLTARGGPVPQTPPGAEAAPRQDFFQSMDARTYRAQAERGERKGGAEGAARSGPSARPAPGVPMAPAPRTSPMAQTAPEIPAAPTSQTSPGAGRHPLPVWDTDRRPTARLSDSGTVQSVTYGVSRTAPAAIPPVPEPPAAEAARPGAAVPEEAEGQTSLAEGAVPWRICGEVLRTYIVCEDAEETVWLIDKHAAHERINFDRLRSQREAPMRQALLRPAAVELSREDHALLLESLPLLERLGFACEDFGGGAVLVREVPPDIDLEDVPSTLESLAEDLRTGRSPEERRDALLRTMACKAAIKGGWTSDPAELASLVERVRTGEVRYCPHGRPVAVKLSKHEIERMFKRA